MKYEYLLYTWGGFYNKEHQKEHKQKSGYHYFDTEQKRNEYLYRLKVIEKRLNARFLVTTMCEGYHTRSKTVLHRVIKWKGKEYHSKYEMIPNTSYMSAKYHLDNKWFPGFNDYPLGEDFDYEKNKVEVVQEWTTGAFDTNEDTE